MSLVFHSAAAKKVKEIMSEIEKDKVLDAVNELENKIDDLSLVIRNPNVQTTCGCGSSFAV